MYPLQLIIDVCNTATPKTFPDSSIHIYRAPPAPIDNRSMEYHYTKCFTYSRMPPTPIDHRCMEYHYTKEVSHIAQCTYT